MPVDARKSQEHFEVQPLSKPLARLHWVVDTFQYIELFAFLGVIMILKASPCLLVRLMNVHVTGCMVHS